MTHKSINKLDQFQTKLGRTFKWIKTDWAIDLSFQIIGLRFIPIFKDRPKIPKADGGGGGGGEGWTEHLYESAHET